MFKTTSQVVRESREKEKKILIIFNIWRFTAFITDLRILTSFINQLQELIKI